jgi:hypothetical protein
MGEPGSFERIGDSERRLYGPRGVLVCGVPPGEQGAVAGLVQGGGLPVVFVSDRMAHSSLKELLALKDGAGRGEESGLRRAVVMSGFAERELQWFMAEYRKLKLERPLWATLTPVSENWKIERLLEELAAEDAEMGRRAEGGADG